MIKVSHFVGLSGIGGVQSNFVEYMNYQLQLDSALRHKIYTLGKVDPYYKLPFNVHNIGNLLNLLFLIADIIDKRKVVHFYNNLTSVKVAFLLFFIPVNKLILHERGTVWNFPASRGMLLRFIVSKASIVIANSNATKIMLEEKFNISSYKIRVLHNGINVSRKYITRKTHKSNYMPFRIGFIGRLDTPKGIHVLIDAMQYLTEYNIELVIAGNGALEHTLKKQAKHLDNVSFIGRVSEPYSFFRKINLLVVPSIREPLGNVCIEAGLCKVPVLAANVDGLPEIIDDGVSGELIYPTKEVSFKDVSGSGALPLPEFVVNPITQKIEPPKQIDKLLLSNKIIELYNSPDTLSRYGEQLHKKVVKYFNMERYTRDLNNIYFEVNG